MERHLHGDRPVPLALVMKPCTHIRPSTMLRRSVARFRFVVGFTADGAAPDDAGQHRGLGDGHVRGRLTEVSARCRFHAVKPIAEVDLVQINLENLILAVHVFDSLGEYRLAHFSPKCLVARKKADARELLRNRARPFGRAAFANVAEHRADDADAIDAVMLVKAPVFDCDHGIPQVRRNKIEFNFHSVLSWNGKDGPVVGVVHHCPFGRFANHAQLVCTREAGNHLIEEPSSQQNEESR